MSRQVQYTILSESATSPMPAMGCLLELDDVLLEATDGQLCVPVRDPPRMGRKVRNRIWPYRVPTLPPRRAGAEQVLVVTGISFHILTALYSIPSWRKRYDVVCAFIMDAHAGYRLPSGVRKSRFARMLGALDHLFVPMTGNLDELQRGFGVRATLVPFACDVLQWGSHNVDRPIDVIGYGRQPWAQSRALAKAFNSPQSSRIYQHTDFMSHFELRNQREQRALFWKQLQRSHISLAYDPRVTDPHRFPFSILAQRWMEGLAAGCLIAGRRPDCPETAMCFDWEDALVELPDDEAELLPCIEALLNDTARLNRAHYQNHLQALQRHDWRHRVSQMLDTLVLPRPLPLVRGLEELAARASALSQLGPPAPRAAARA